MTEERDIEEDMKPSTGDYVYTGVKAGLSTIPVYGGAVTNLLANIIPAPLEKRRTKWFIDFDKRLQLLEETVEGFSSKRLAENEIFISMFFYATNVAIRTHQEEKLEALRNAVTNSILHPEIDESLQLMFLNFIDEYTSWHLTLLQFFDAYGQSNSSSLNITRDVIGNEYPELIGKQAIYEQMVRDLISDGVLEITTSYGKRMTDQRLVAFEITDMGKQFLEIIRCPVKE